MASSNDRQRQLARERYERQQQRKAEHHRSNRNRGLVIASVIAVLGVIGAVAALFALSGTSTKKPASALAQHTPSAQPVTPTASVAPTSAAAASGQCTYTKAGTAAKNVGTPPATPAKQDVGVRIELGQGVLQGVLYGTKAPCTVNSFTYLASKNYFAGTKCHRLTTTGIYVLQCGDPTGTGSGGPGYQFKDENLTGLGTAANAQATYPAGTLAMANAGPGTNGSQFFIVYKNSPLAASYTPFGKITQGLDIVQKIATKGSNNANGPGDGAPKQPVVIKAVSVLQ